MSTPTPDRDRATPPGHHPNQTTANPSDSPDVPALPRDPNQPIHRKPRVFIHRMSEDPAAETEALRNTSYISALSTVSLSDFTKVHQTPCFRDALLPAIGGGSALAATRFVMGGSLRASGNWFAAGLVGVSTVMYQVCQNRRRYDKEGIRRAVAVLDEKQRLKDAREAEAKTREKERGGVEAAGKSVWGTFKFW